MKRCEIYEEQEKVRNIRGAGKGVKNMRSMKMCEIYKEQEKV
jgi:hypothetical protein